MSATALISHPESACFFLLALKCGGAEMATLKGTPKVTGTDADVQAMSALEN